MLMNVNLSTTVSEIWNNSCVKVINLSKESSSIPEKSPLSNAPVKFPAFIKNLVNFLALGLIN